MKDLQEIISEYITEFLEDEYGFSLVDKMFEGGEDIITDKMLVLIDNLEAMIEDHLDYLSDKIEQMEPDEESDLFD